MTPIWILHGDHRRAPMQNMFDLVSNPGSLRVYTSPNKLQEKNAQNFTESSKLKVNSVLKRK